MRLEQRTCLHAAHMISSRAPHTYEILMCACVPSAWQQSLTQDMLTYASSQYENLWPIRTTNTVTMTDIKRPYRMLSNEIENNNAERKRQTELILLHCVDTLVAGRIMSQAMCSTLLRLQIAV